MALHIVNRRRHSSSIAREFPGAPVIDVTSRGPEPWVRFSPFFPHGGIPVPFSPGVTGESVEGIWQALKVFEHDDVDPRKLRVTTMRGIKRTTRTFGAVRGHRAGLTGETLLSYVDARKLIYLPAYRWVLENRTQKLVEELREMAADSDVVLLDYNVNGDIEDVARPLSHAALVRCWIEHQWPT